MDLAGTVVEVGAGVTDFAVDDEVYGIGVGTYAEFARAKANKLAHRPATLPAEQAAALTISGSTACQALFDVGRAESGQRVLVLGASGGVGSFAVQLAKARGLHVTAVASGAKRDHVLALGADVVLDYAVDDFTEQPPFDLIIDVGGRNKLSTLRRAITGDGTLVIVGGENGGSITGGTGRQLRAMLLSPFVSQRLTSFIAKETVDRWAQLRELVESGDVTAPVDRTYRLDEAVDALDDLEAGRVRGKAVIVVAPR
jgi:NADPH:quinone reductase-like Zn-dependent oxidoreductase